MEGAAKCSYQREQQRDSSGWTAILKALRDDKGGADSRPFPPLAHTLLCSTSTVDKSFVHSHLRSSGRAKRTDALVAKLETSIFLNNTVR